MCINYKLSFIFMNFLFSFSKEVSHKKVVVSYCTKYTTFLIVNFNFKFGNIIQL